MIDPPPEEPSFGPDRSGWSVGSFLVGLVGWGLLGNGLVLFVMFIIGAVLNSSHVRGRPLVVSFAALSLTSFVGLLVFAIHQANRAENRGLRDGIATAVALTGAGLCLLLSICGHEFHF